MKPFKFFVGINEYKQWNRNGLPPIERRYVGLERGVIKWINQAVGMVYYLEPTIGTDPINENSIPEIALRLLSHTVTTQTYTYITFDQFLDANAEKYIFIYQVIEMVNGTIHTSEDTIPLGVPLMIRAAILD